MIHNKSRFYSILDTGIGLLYQYDRYTVGHSLRVAQLSEQIAVSMLCSRTLIERVCIAALMHDIGKIFIPKHILNKPGSLTQHERTIIQSHALFGYMILGQFEALETVKDIVLHHHERYDGQGYPHGLKMERIPVESRIITVADTFDALTSNRVYHGAMFYREAQSEINNHSYNMFDPLVVEHFNWITRDMIKHDFPSLARAA